MSDIQVLSTGLIYRNPKPFLRSVHAYFPSVTHLGGREMLAAFQLGSAFEAVDCHTVAARSLDDGQTWTLERPLAKGAPRPGISDLYKIMSDGGEVVGFGGIMHRDDPEMGLSNPANLGFVRTEAELYRSRDKGRTWTAEPIKPPLKGPEFEFCSPIVPLPDGRWLAPTSTWKDWNGDCPNGMKAIAFVSRDRGRTWPEYVNILDGSAENVIYWEQNVLPLSGNRVISLAWAHDMNKDADRPNHYALSTDGGRSFGPPQSTGLIGQTPRLIALGKDLVLVMYRRIDKAGFWAQLVSLEGNRWRNLEAAPIWGAARQGLTKTKDRDSMVEEFHQLKFGAPTALVMPDGTVFVALWCVEECVSNIRWFRIKVA